MTLEGASAALARNGVDLSPGQLSRLERGHSDISAQRIEQLARLYGWKPGELLSGRGTDEHGIPRARMVPLIDSVQAGQWTEVIDPYEKGDAWRWVPAPSEVGQRAFALKVEGNSMEPDFQPGDTIIVDPERAPRPGDLVVARIDAHNAATFKRYRVKAAAKGRMQVELVPLNPDWPTLSIDERNGGRLVGVVTDHIRRLV